MSNLVLVLILCLLILIFCYQFGFGRYFQLHSDKLGTKMRDLILSYHKIPHHGQNFKIVVSLSTKLEKINDLKTTIKSILSQNVRIDEIALNIPEDEPQFSNEISKISKDIKDSVNLFWCGYDYREQGMNWFPTLLREKNEETLIIVLQEGFVYEKKMIKNILKFVNRYPDEMLYDNAVLILKPKFLKEDLIDITNTKLDYNTLFRYLKVPKRKINLPNNYQQLYL